MIAQQTSHDADALRFAFAGPGGWLELRILAFGGALIYHTCGAPFRPCGCDAECVPGSEMALAWAAAGYDDAEIWRLLEQRSMELEVIRALADAPQFPPTPQQLLFRQRLRDTPYDG